MKMNVRSIIALIAIASSVFVLAACSSDTPEQRADKIMEHIKNQLDLNEAQAAKLNRVREELVPMLLKEQQAMKKNREFLLFQLKSEKMDAAAVQKELDSTFDRLKQETDVLVPLIAEFQATLSPKQKQKLPDFNN